MAKKPVENIAIIEDIVPTDFCEEMSASFVDYSVSVITDRAIPDVRDGLKPVQRRILWAMNKDGIHADGQYKKVAKVVGTTMGAYHPHGDSSIEGALVHMGQPWCFPCTMIDGHGNFGSVEGDAAAASRYIECRLSKYSDDVLLSNLNTATVDFRPNYDDTDVEPTVLPAILPNILLMGTEGIAVGMASKMPSHNLGDTVDAAIAMLDNPKITDSQLMEHLKGPDFATGGIIVNKSELPTIYAEGQGKIRIRGRVRLEDAGRGRKNIVVTEIPCTMIGAIDGFMDAVAELVRGKLLPDVTDIKNFSDKEGIRIVLELRKDADVDQTLSVLYKKARLEDTFGYNATLLSNGVPAVMPITRIMREYLAFFRETMTRKYKNLLEKERKVAEVKEGLIQAVDCIDTIIEILRGSKTVPVAKKCLMTGNTADITFKTKTAAKQASTLHFSEIQADAILEMKMQKLVGLELDTLQSDLSKALKNIESYEGLLNSKTKMTNKMRSDMLEMKDRFNTKRRTDLIDADAIVMKKPEVKEEKLVALINRFGYVKLVDTATFNRNKDNAVSEYRYICDVMNIGKIFVLTDAGKCHQIKAQNVPLGRYNDKGSPIDQLAEIASDENIIGVVSDLNAKGKILMATAGGYVKRMAISELNASRKTTDATKLSDADKLVFAGEITGKCNAILITGKRLCVCFDSESLGLLKKNSQGVTGIKLEGSDRVEAIILTSDGEFEYEGQKYSLDAIKANKRGTKGKTL